MKGDVFTFTPKKVDLGGVSPNVIRLTDEKYVCNHLYYCNRSFTPDDKRVVFQSQKDGGNNLFVMDLATNKVTQLTQGYNLDYYCYPSRDGKKVFFGADGCIKAVNLETCEEEIVVRAQDIVKEPVTKCSGVFPSWDGKTLVCFYEASPDWGLIIADLVTGKNRILIHGEHPLRHCQFCPNDSNLIIYAHEGKWQTINARMWLIHADGTNNRRVRTRDAGDDESLGRAGHEFWANTSRTLYFTLLRDGKVYIARYDVAQHKEEIVCEIEPETEELAAHRRDDTGIDHATLTMDDKYLISDSKWGNGELYIINVATKEKKILCYHKHSWAITIPKNHWHTHPSVSYTTNQVIFNSDGYGRPGIFIADLPKF